MWDDKTVAIICIVSTILFFTHLVSHLSGQSENHKEPVIMAPFCLIMLATAVTAVLTIVTLVVRSLSH